MPFEALKERIKILKMEGKIVSKMFNNANSFYISQKEVFEVIPRTPEPDLQFNPQASLKLVAPYPNQTFRSSLRELETEILELKSFVLKQCFIKQSTNINSGCSLPIPSSDNNQQLVKTLLDQIEHLKKELTCKNTIILCLDKNGKPFPISDQKSSNNSNSSKVIENSSQNQNEDSNVA